MIKRSQCKCLCHSGHTDLVGTHIHECCEPDDVSTSEQVKDALREFADSYRKDDKQVKTYNKALADLLDDEWNSAIEEAADRAKQTTYKVSDDTMDTFTINEIRKLKRSVGK